jgi:hypothetical protein
MIGVTQALPNNNQECGRCRPFRKAARDTSQDSVGTGRPGHGSQISSTDFCNKIGKKTGRGPDIRVKPIVRSKADLTRLGGSQRRAG